MYPTPHRLFIGKDNHKFFVSHMTVLPDGTKERLHGHNYMVSLRVDLRDISFQNFLHFDVFKKSMEAQCKEWDEHVLIAEQNPHLRVVKRLGIKSHPAIGIADRRVNARPNQRPVGELPVN